MKSWFAAFRISNTLDSGEHLSPRLRRRLEQDADLRAFAESAMRVDRHLGAPAQGETTPWLHESIMQAIRAAQPERRPSLLLTARWLAIPGLAVLLLLGGWWLVRPAPPPPSLEVAATALAQGQEIAKTIPSTLLAPLNDEWQKLGLDLDRTAQFLLASLP